MTMRSVDVLALCAATMVCTIACGNSGQGTQPLYEYVDGIGDGEPNANSDTTAVHDAKGSGGVQDGTGTTGDVVVPAKDGAAAKDAPTTSSQPDVTWKGMPQIEVKLDGAVKTALVFEYDSNPQTQPAVMKAKVEINNFGDVPLKIKAILFKTESPQLALTWWETPLKPADYPYELEPFVPLTLSVEFTIKPKLKASKTATLEILSDDPVQPEVALAFATPCTGAKPVITPGAVELINAGPFKPRTVCFQIGNLGCMPWLYSGASFEPNNGAWSIYEEPPANDQIQEIGTPANPWTKPKKLKICARFQPKKVGDASATKLVVKGKESFAGQPIHTASASLKGIWQPESGFRFQCGGPAIFDFGPTASKPTTLSCTVVNDGPAAMKLNAFTLAPGTDYAQQTAIDAAFSAKVVVPGQAKALALPFTLAAGQGVKLSVTWQPTAADPPPTRAVLNWRQGGDEGDIEVPVHAGPCNESAPEASPLPMGFHSPSGQVKTRFELANWSCTPLKVMKHCTTLYNVTQFSACETGAPSAEYSVVGAMPDVVPAWSSAPVEVLFKPGGGSRKDHLGQLHLFYCPGEWTGGKCSKKMDRIEVQLEGNVLPSVKPPSMSLTAPAGIKAGHAARLIAKVTPGSHAIGMFGAFHFTVTGRPPGSKAWIFGGPVDGNELIFVPDVPGSYTISANVAAFTAGDLASQSYSEQALVSFVAK